MIIPSVGDVAFNLFGTPVYKYGITLAFAILVGILVSNWFWNKLFSKDKNSLILEYAPLIIVFGILGARLYFCCLNFDYYFSNPLEILNIRGGGLSIHGAIFGGILCMFLISQKLKLNLLNILDSTSCGIILGQAIGRWGNYFNSEAYGLPVLNQTWGLFIPIEKRVPEYVNCSLFHPTFLYESILDFAIFLIISFIFLSKGVKNKGLTTSLYLILYSVVRFFIEQIRVDSALNVGGVHIAQIISVGGLVCGVLLLIYSLKPVKK